MCLKLASDSFLPSFLPSFLSFFFSFFLSFFLCGRVGCYEVGEGGGILLSGDARAAAVSRIDEEKSAGWDKCGPH